MHIKKRNEIIQIFRKFSLHKAMRKKMLYDFIDEIDEYYKNNPVEKNNGK